MVIAISVVLTGSAASISDQMVACAGRAITVTGAGASDIEVLCEHGVRRMGAAQTFVAAETREARTTLPAGKKKKTTAGTLLISSVQTSAVTTGIASEITETGATLNGTVDPNGRTTTARFEYGLTTSYGSRTPDQPGLTGTTALPVSAPVTGLAPGTTYHFRISATNSDGTSVGADGVFTTTIPPPPPGGDEAAVVHGWGPVVTGDEFNYTGAPDPTKWSVYDGPGHAGNGIRSPAAWNVDGSDARVTGDPDGTTGGMSALFAKQQYGRWEARMRTSAQDPQYHPVMLLWPSGDLAGEWEIDYAEGTTDTTRMRFFLHDCCGGQTTASQVVDTQQWHNYAVEWTPEHVVGYIDAVEWFRDEDPAHNPPGMMKQALQLDWFSSGPPPITSWMEVDWVRVYDSVGFA